jgi:hypothetical protein
MFYAAAGATAVAGIIHLILGVGNNNTNTQILFVVGGAAQLFWVLPMIRRWGIVWYLVGIGGTITFFAIWAITRIPDNPITGRGGSINQNGIIVEVAQLAFIALNIAILVMERRKKAKI